jgi:hypothetical protein
MRQRTRTHVRKPRAAQCCVASARHVGTRRKQANKRRAQHKKQKNRRAISGSPVGPAAGRSCAGGYQGVLEGYSRGTRGVLEGYSRGTKGYTRGTRGVLEGYSRGIRGGTRGVPAAGRSCAGGTRSLASPSHIAALETQTNKQTNKHTNTNTPKTAHKQANKRTRRASGSHGSIFGTALNTTLGVAVMRGGHPRPKCGSLVHAGGGSEPESWGRVARGAPGPGADVGRGEPRPGHRVP